MINVSNFLGIYIFQTKTILQHIKHKENDKDFTPIEVASAAIVAACEKIENQLSPTNGHCCC